MTHDFITQLAMNSGLIFFVILFVGVVAYVMRPANRETFDQAAKVPLDRDED